MKQVCVLRLLTMIASIGILFSVGSSAQTYKTIYDFNGTGLFYPTGVVRDTGGNLYGLATGSGNCTVGTASTACGVIFELSLGSSGQWSRAIIHTFGGADGAYPGGLVIDSKGNLYGNTGTGGPGANGSVFMLSHGSSGWSEQLLYNYAESGYQGYGLVLDSSGNVYGIDVGGHYNLGRVFELQNSSGTWSASYIYSFGVPEATAPSYLAADSEGNLYGTDPQGEYNHNFQGGTIYKISPGTNGVWTSSIIYEFFSTRYFKSELFSGVTIDPFNNLYGFAGGTSWKGFNDGPYELLAPDYTQSQFVWGFQNERYLGVADYPGSPMAFDSLGNVYGSADNQDSQLVHHPYDGYVFRNGPSGEAVYYFPTLPPAQRYYPYGTLAVDGQGNVYGTTSAAYYCNCGVGSVFEITF